MKLQKLLLIPIVCFALLANTQAVIPPPDGGYPGGNTAEGQTALLSLTTGGYNTAVGFFSLRSDTTGSLNTAIGAGALLAAGAVNGSGNENTATGAGALLSVTTGEANTANGAFALFSSTAASGNTAIGHMALQNNTTGSGNIAVGAGAGFNVTTAFNAICIGAAGANVDNSCYIENIHGKSVDFNTTLNVVIDAHGKVGTQGSSRRFKDDIKPMDKASEAILSLKPVTFHYKSDNTNTLQFGLIAEEVAKVSPDLVVRDKNGAIYTVRYEAVNAMLLNEFLKEHRKVETQQNKIEEQETRVAQLTKDFQSKFAQQERQIEALASGLEKVSAHIEMSKAALHVACLPVLALGQDGKQP